MSHCVGSPRISVGCTGMAIGLVLGWQALSSPVFAQNATTETLQESELLLSPSTDRGETAGSGSVLSTIERTPSFEELDSAASDLNEALSGARAKLDELRQATELAAMAAELREELETSIQENNRLAASLAEVQSERSELESQNIEAQRQIVELSETVESSKLELASQADQLERRRDEIEEITGARNNAEDQVRELELQLGRTDDEVDQLRDEIVELTGLLEATRTELNEANDRADEARLARDSADQELSKVRKQIAGMLRSVLLGGEPIDVSNLENENGSNGVDNLALGVRYEAIRASNVRAEPDPDSERVGFAKRGDFVTVLNKVNGRNWFEIETAEGVRGFIFGDLIRPDA